ncbi:Putative ATPase [Actinacidiphila cocklensis]|uniref:ATPase n=1 Tax=Actinacidiphila cocklensis TaxID=887465 RepID=A0A9W4DI44_9ACTN|nr:Putative ATPase [Actinacidiphila cocklensis]
MSGSEGSCPDPGRAADLAEFITALNEYRLWAGGPSYRALARRVGPLLRSTQGVSQSTIGDVFQARRKRLDLDLVVAIVRALGAGEPTVARWRAACVAVQARAKNGGPAGVFRQLPRAPATFTGRERELAGILRAALSPAGRQTAAVCVIEGMGGVGKTQLALQAAHTLVRSGKFADVQLYVDLHGVDANRPPAAPAEVLGGFLRALGVPVQHIPDGVVQRAAMFRDRLRGRAALILLDNAADEAQVRDVIGCDPSCLVLITSRRSLAGLDGTSVHVLDALTVRDSVELLAATAGRERIAAEIDDAVRVAELCGGLPLAVALAGARLRARTGWRVADAAEYLAEGGLDAIRAGGRALRPVLDLSYARLPEPARGMFRLLGLHPGGDFTPRTAAALAGVDPAVARDLLECLQDEHLVRQGHFGRFGLPDLLRVYAAGLARERPEEADAAVARLLAFCLHSARAAGRFLAPPARPLDVALPAGCTPMAFADRAQALQWCEEELPGLLAAVRLAAQRGHHAVAWQLPVVLSDYLLLHGRAHDWVGAMTIAVESARASNDVRGEAAALDRLGIAQAVTKDYPASLETLRQAFALHTARGTAHGDVRGRALTTDLAVVRDRA